MKKSLVVLLIAVLALTSAFAETIKGSASASYTFDLDDKTATYDAKANATATFTFSKTFTAGTKGEGNPYILVDGSVKVAYDPQVAHDASISGTVAKLNYVAKDSKTTLTFDLATFKVVGEGWDLDFLAKFKALDFAKSAIDTKTEDDGKTYNYTYAVAAPTVSPVLKLTKEEVGSITFIGSRVATPTDAKTTTIGVELESDADGFAITPELTANAGITVYSTKVNTKAEANVDVAVSAKTAYVGEVATSELAADFGWISKKLSGDIAFNAKYGVFTLDAYYGKGEIKANKTTMTDVPAKGYFSAQVVADVPEIKTVFTANGKNLFNDEKYNFNFDVETTYFEHFTLTAGVEDLTHAGRIFNLGAEATFTEYGTTAYAKLTKLTKAAKPTLALGFTWTDQILTLAADYAYDFAKTDAKKAATFEFDAKYAAEKYTATAGLFYNTYVIDKAVKNGWYLTAGISSDFVVNGATLALDYASKQLDAPAGLGTITASCKVTF